MTAHGGNVWQGDSPGSWLDFSANLRPEGPPDWVMDALRAGLGEARYYPDLSMRREREGLAAFLGVDAACVLPTAGGVSALDLAMGLGTGGVLLAVPCFSEYAALAKKRGLQVTEAPISELPDAARRLPAGGLICLGNPVNPLGRAFTRREIMALLGAAEAARGWLLLDEAFIEYCPERTARDLIPAHGRLIVAGSMTKILCVPGARLGYLLAQPDLVASMAARQLTWEVSCFAGAVARALPGHGADIRAIAALNAGRRESLRRSLEALGARVYPSEASFLLARFDRPTSSIAAALKEKKILVRECMDFAGVDDGRHLRLAVRDEAANARLIAALREVISCGENH